MNYSKVLPFFTPKNIFFEGFAYFAIFFVMMGSGSEFYQLGSPTLADAVLAKGFVSVLCPIVSKVFVCCI